MTIQILHTIAVVNSYVVCLRFGQCIYLLTRESNCKTGPTIPRNYAPFIFMVETPKYSFESLGLDDQGAVKV